MNSSVPPRRRVLLVPALLRVIRSPISLLFSVPALVPFRRLGSGAGTLAPSSTSPSSAAGTSSRSCALSSDAGRHEVEVSPPHLMARPVGTEKIPRPAGAGAWLKRVTSLEVMYE